MILVVGTTSPVKVRAVERAIALMRIHCRVEAVDAPSGVRPQPLNFEESYRGACTRVRNALAMSESADLGLGIEQGILFPGYDDAPALDGAVVVLANRRGRIVGMSTSACTPIPRWIVDRLRTGEEHGEIIRSITGSHEKDPTRFWTKGALPREEQLAQAVIAAFVPFVSEGVFSRPPEPVKRS